MYTGALFRKLGNAINLGIEADYIRKSDGIQYLKRGNLCAIAFEFSKTPDVRFDRERWNERGG